MLFPRVREPEAGIGGWERQKLMSEILSPLVQKESNQGRETARYFMILYTSTDPDPLTLTNVP